MTEHVSMPAEQALLRAFQARGYRALILNGTTAQIITPNGSRDLDAGLWLRQAAPLHPSQLAGFADQYAAWALQTVESGPAVPDLASEKLSVFIYPDEEVGKYREALMLRDLAPGLLQMVMMDDPDGGFDGLRRGRLAASDQEVFAAAVSRSIAGRHSIAEHELGYGKLTSIQTERPDAAAHVHVVARHIKPAEFPHGALVSFPAADYLLIYPLGQAHPLESMFDMNNATQKAGQSAKRAVTGQIYWWRPGRYEHLAEGDALRSGQLPELRPVGMTMSEKNPQTGAVDVKLTTPETGELFALFGA